MYGQDKTILEELTKTVTDLEGLKIEIIEKTEKTSELNNTIEKMENQIKQVDENLLNNTQFATTGSETATENTNEEQQKIKTSENSNLNILISNIDTLTEKVNQAVKVETERKAEEERKAKELEAKKVYAGTYKNNQGKTQTITLNENGELYYRNYKININNKTNDKAILVSGSSNEYVNDSCYLYPIGIKSPSIYNPRTNSGSDTDKSKIRLIFYGSAVPTIEDVYYKVD